MADGTEVDDEDGLRGIKAEGVLYVTAQQGFSIKDFPEASTGEESDTTILLNSSCASLSSEEGAYSDLSTSTTTTEEQLHIPRELLPFAFRKCIENKEVPSPRDKRTVARAIADMIV
ncbi:hypothetical protein HOLleu_03328 [Holothuria leucospilota]|uniref:Uncharacterized protein n=1 Tax=Holothuria leucospilota TaxID=206669 RepID=A0A9Q1CSF8_HOLLE|nr:hypothetical protein HOLleu_03328 [Holothuria leucospilota]